MNLNEWTINFVKHKDIIHRKLEGHEEKGNKIIFKFKDRSEDYIINEKLSAMLPCSNKATLVCQYNEENFNTFLKNWKELVKNKELTIVFVNPEKNAKWQIRPYTHNLIADPDSLDLGLRTMFEASSE
ncbi:hypothetical protein ACFL1B_01315 [Nanoarchaeota archaeon]